MKGTKILKAAVCLILCAAAVFVEVLRRNEIVRGVLRILLRKWNEKILPNHPVDWLKNYDSKYEVRQNLRFTEEFQEERPNILLIVADDLGINDLSGGAGVLTPNMDSIAKNGLNFTQAYAAQSTCAPSRAALFTGRYPTNIGFEFTPVPKFLARFLAKKLSNVNSPQPVYNAHLFNQVPDMLNIALPKDVPTVPELLSQVGYHNYLVGKWDGGFLNDSLPIGRGFDESLSMESGGSLYMKNNDPRIVKAENISFDTFLKRVLSFKVSHNNGPFFEPDAYLTDYLGSQSVKLIEQLGEKKKEFKKQQPLPKHMQSIQDNPWFMAVTFTAPHNPFQALKSDFEREDIQKIPTFMGKIYAAMIHALDRNVGKLIQSLKDSNQYENTLIILTSDNGAAPYVGLPDLNAPYRGWKGTLFEGGIHIPFFLQWPKKIKAINKSINDMIIQIDILPTIYSLATKGIEFLSNASLKEMISDGRNLLEPYLPPSVASPSSSKNISSRTNNSALFYRNQSHEFDSMKIEKRALFWRSGNYKALRFGDYKLQIHSNPNKIWFYNLKIDPTERHNLMDYLNADVADDSHSYPHIHNVSQLEDYMRFHVRNTTFSGQQREQQEEEKSPLTAEITVNGVVLMKKAAAVRSSPKRLLLSEEVAIPPLTRSVLPAAPAFPKKSLRNHRHYSEIIDISHESFYNRDILLSNLIHCYEKLKEIDRSQRKPLWPALTEVPVCIDKPAMSSNDCLLTDEYIVWPN